MLRTRAVNEVPLRGAPSTQTAPRGIGQTIWSHGFRGEAIRPGGIIAAYCPLQLCRDQADQGGNQQAAELHHHPLGIIAP
jgi:hypothetical protein